jgi:hypothetical protein
VASPESASAKTKTSLTKNASVNVSVFFASVMASTVVVLTALTIRDYFFFIPFEYGINFVSILGAFTLLGWITLTVGPPVITYFAARSSWNSLKVWLLIVTATIWTISTTIIKIYGLAALDEWWGAYLGKYPIMLFIEWILPIAYVVYAWRIRRDITNPQS